TDTASVLSEAIEYIKFLHEQVTVLSTPYMKSGAPIEIHQPQLVTQASKYCLHFHLDLNENSSKSKKSESAKQDLKSRGLCLVPVSSTFPVTHETTVDFWTPTFGGTSR
ncbi:transcription factor bHLH123-like protein, partial [Trifolium pratense]